MTTNQRASTLAGVAMVYIPIRSGGFVAHRIRVDGRRVTIIETAAGSVGSVAALLVAPPNGRGEPLNQGSVLSTAAGTWTIPIAAGGRGVSVVFDANGQEAARVDRLSRTTKALHLRSGTLTWVNRALRPQYEVEGAFTANRRVMHKIAPGFTRRPFAGAITPSLAERPDGSLALMLAVWCTVARINAKAQREALDSGTP